MRISGLTLPRSIDSAATSGLMVEPGSKVSVTARFRNCSPDRRAIVRIEARIVGEREHFAILRIEHDDAARARLVFRDRRLQLRMRELLKAPVDRQLNRLAVLRQICLADLRDYAS